MSATKLNPGDKISFVQNGRILRGIIADNLTLRTKGEPLLIPIIRPRSKKISADTPGKTIQPKVRWLERKLIRKLPE